MTATTPTMFRRLEVGLAALAALTVLLVALAPVAKAEPKFEFKPGVFARAHPPLHTETAPVCPGIFQCVFFGGGFGIDVSEWVEATANAPEATQAGGHPDFTTSFNFDRVEDTVRTVLTDAPAGAVGNPRAVPRCEAADFHLSQTGKCPPASQVGVSVTFASDLFFLSPVSMLWIMFCWCVIHSKLSARGFPLFPSL